ncbi:MAG TPA: hypothetical protein VFT84_10335 [Gemmatimonadales bacterium]|nr:hypothetical protein [Gemmatimonadales bacterium]
MATAGHLVTAWRPLLLAAMLAGSACRETSGALSPEQERRLAAETVVRRADDLVFRYTRDPGGRRERREDRLASIVVTRASLLVHKNAKVGIEITPRSRREYAVERAGERVRIRAGRGQSEEVWSFVPPDDAAGWVSDIRAVIRGAD